MHTCHTFELFYKKIGRSSIFVVRLISDYLCIVCHTKSRTGIQSACAPRCSIEIMLIFASILCVLSFGRGMRVVFFCEQVVSEGAMSIKPTLGVVYPQVLLDIRAHVFTVVPLAFVIKNGMSRKDKL